MILNLPCDSIPSGTFRPLTGTILQDSEQQTGLGGTVENGMGHDGVMVLAQPDDTPVAAFYVRSEESFTLESIRDGTYHLLFTTGEVRRDAP